MKFDAVSDIKNLIIEGIENTYSRHRSFMLRKKVLSACISTKSGIVKTAFDTRRINQETEYNPRRNLQNYNRSEQFISEAVVQKIKNFSKIRNALVELKEEYGKEPKWQDSNARVLLSTLDKGLRIGLNDGDFSENQQSMASLDYIEELLHVRYRLGLDELTKIGASDLKKVLLSKDEELVHQDINNNLQISKRDIATQNYDTLLEKLFGGLKATKDSPEVERTVTITIKDKVVG